MLNSNLNIFSTHINFPRIVHLTFVIVISFFTSTSLFANAIILKDKAATALNKVILYPDSTFNKHSNIYYKEGELFEVIGKTFYEHEDDAQNQKFRWYKVKTKEGRTGWIFGDGLAIILPKKEIPEKLKSIHKKKQTFSRGFDDTIIWIAGIEGRDNFHDNDYLNPLYKEHYIVITNKQNKSVHINYEGFSAIGRTELGEFYFQDLTNDNLPEFVLQKNSFNDKNMEHRNLEIYSIQSANLVKIFEERMSLNLKNNQKSPALFKHIEIDQNTIRIEYPDLVRCKKTSPKNELCMDFVTYTYVWNSTVKNYELLYDESRTAPVGRSKHHSIPLLENTTLGARSITYVSQNDRFQILKQHEKSVLNNGIKKTSHYLYIKLNDGKKGYVHASDVRFEYMVHGQILQAFYKTNPDKNSWNFPFAFLEMKNFKPQKKIMATKSPNH